MQAAFAGSVRSGSSSIVFGQVVFNEEQEICMHCQKLLKPGEKFAALQVEGLADIIVHLECTCIFREGRRLRGGAVRAG